MAPGRAAALGARFRDIAGFAGRHFGMNEPEPGANIFIPADLQDLNIDIDQPPPIQHAAQCSLTEHWHVSLHGDHNFRVTEFGSWCLQHQCSQFHSLLDRRRWYGCCFQDQQLMHKSLPHQQWLYDDDSVQQSVPMQHTIDGATERAWSHQIQDLHHEQ
eukprot:3863902-Rhodomonas_salina.1